MSGLVGELDVGGLAGRGEFCGDALRCLPYLAVRHAIYLFTHQAILALYALCSERISTPALLASEGGLLSFMRVDFDRLLDQSDRIT
ncbi:MAG TPA: hypothetical protein VMV92_09030 [Streptosporangiaceae bacterium]|nr:hypothetical protein [Streptosporangiaceae bacterium]